MLYWISEFQENNRFIEELEDQLNNAEKFNKSYYESKTKMNSDLKKAKFKKLKNQVIMGSTLIPLITTGIYMAYTGNLSINEIFESVEISFYTAKAAILGAGALGALKLGSTLVNSLNGNIKDSAELIDQGLAEQKAKFVKDFFSENEFISKLNQDDIISVGSCYAYQKKISKEKKNKMPPFLYKKSIELSDNSPMVKNWHKNTNGRNLSGMNEMNFHKEVLNYVDNILEHPINEKVEDVFREHKKLKDKSGSRFSFEQEVFKTLEGAFDEVYKETQTEQFQNIVVEFIIKSNDDKEYFKRNADEMNKYITRYKDIEVNISETKLKDFFEDVERQMYKLSRNKKIESRFKERNEDKLDKFKVENRNEILKRVDEKFVNMMCDMGLDNDSYLKEKSPKYAAKQRETFPEKRISNIITDIKENGIEEKDKEDNKKENLINKVLSKIKNR